MKKYLEEINDALFTGTSYLSPIVITGGILTGLMMGIAGNDIWTYEPYSNLISTLYQIGQLCMQLIFPVLGAYVAYSLADKAGLPAGFVGGAIAKEFGTGFFGALIAGILAGYIARTLKKIEVPGMLKLMMAMLVVPLLSILAVSFLMLYVFNPPVTAFMNWFLSFLNGLGNAGAILGVIMGMGAGFDMGGPVTKTIGSFVTAMATAGDVKSTAAMCIVSCIPPLTIGFAMLISKKHWSEEEYANMPGCLLGGFCSVSEFAIPVAARNPMKVIPALMIGSAVGGAMSYLFGITMPFAYGPLPVYWPICSNPVLFTLCVVVGALVGAICLLLFLGKPQPKEENN